MSQKIQAIVAGVGFGITGFIAWLATVPAEQQSGWLATLVDITPAKYRADVGLFTRLLSLGLGIYATLKSAQSGPKTPPVNPTNTNP